MLILRTALRNISVIAFVVMFGFCFVACGGGQNNLTEDCFEPINAEGKKVAIAEATAYRIIKGKSSLPSVVHIPAKYNGKPVTEIGAAFRDLKHITEINIPNSVTKIGANAFRNCENLTNIKIPNSVTAIGNSAFRLCKNLNKITLPANITSISANLFEGCTALTSFTIPNGVTLIDNEAFKGCTNLTNVTIPDSVTTIDSYAFTFSGLTSITIPKSVTSIKNDAFNRCDSLASVKFETSTVELSSSVFFPYYDLEEKYKAGGAGTYTTANPGAWGDTVWTKQ